MRAVTEYHWSVRSRTGRSFFFLLLLALFHPSLFAHEIGAGILLTNIAQIRALSADDAEHSLAVKVRARVTFVDAHWWLLFIEDSTDGIFVSTSSVLPDLRYGDTVEVTGVTGGGRVSRVLVASAITKLAPLPAIVAERARWRDVLDFARDSRRVEIEGVVQRVWERDSHLYLEVGAGGRRGKVVLPDGTMKAVVPLINQKVRLTGVAGINADDLGRVVASLFCVQSTNHIVLVQRETPAPPDSVHSIADLVNVNQDHRLRVNGVITHRTAPNVLYLSDGSGAIMLSSSNLLAGSVGDEVAASGFLSNWKEPATLVEAELQLTGSVSPADAKLVEATDALKERYESELIAVHGAVISAVKNNGDSLLICESDGIVFSARYTGELHSNFASGTMVRLTGICVRAPAEAMGQPGFRLLLRSPGDVVVIKAPKYWTTGRTAYALGGSLVILCVAGAWILLLRHQVRLKTEVIRQKLEKEAALEAHYSELVDRANDIVYSHSLDGRIISINAAGERLLGYSRGDLAAGILIGQLLPSSDYEKAAQMMEHKLQGGDRDSYEVTFMTRNGSRLVGEINSWLVYKDGKPVAVQGIARDVTARKRAERLNEALIELGRQLSGVTTPIAAARVLTTVAGDSIGWDECTLSFFDAKTESIVPILKQIKRNGTIEDRSPQIDLETFTPIALEVIATGSKIQQLAQDCSWIIVPVRQMSKVLGVLSLQRSAQQYDADDLRSLQALADYGGAALERINVEQFLQANENRFRALTERSSDGIILSDAEGRILYSNETARGLLGADTLRSALADGRDKVHVEDLEHVRQWWAETIASPSRTMQLEFRVQHVDRSWRSIDALAANLLSDDAVRAVVISLRDISERVEAQKAVRKSEALLRQVLDTLPVGVLVVDRTGEVVTRNPASLRIWSSFESSSTGSRQSTKSWHRNNGEPGGRNEWALSRALRNGQVALNELIEVEGADGTKKIILNSAAPIRDSLGAVTGAIVVLEDVTDRLRLENELRQVQKMESVGQLAAGVAHEFNNIMTIVQGYAHLLLDTKNLAPNIVRPLEQIAFGAERAARLTSQLLAFSRKQTVQATALNLGDVVRNWMNMLRPVLGEDIALHCGVDPDLPLVHADASMMEQIVMNLSANARDAMPHGGSLTIRVTAAGRDGKAASASAEARPGEHVCLSVADTGGGIEAKVLPRIFDPFFTTKDVGKGTGLGLATVYGIVKQHHGWVEVASEIGKGTTFKVFLPAHRSGSSQQHVIEARSTQPGGSETILVVEDEPSVRILVEIALKQFGYNVLSAEDGHQALQIWDRAEAKVDLLLTDIVMPHGLSGRDLAEQLRLRKSDLKVLYTSGYAVNGPNRQPLKLDAHARFLPKPYDPTKLAMAVRDALGSNPGKGL